MRVFFFLKPALVVDGVFGGALRGQAVLVLSGPEPEIADGCCLLAGAALLGAEALPFGLGGELAVLQFGAVDGCFCCR